MKSINYNKLFGGIKYGLLIGVAEYRHIKKLPFIVINDVMQINAILTDQQYCGYKVGNVQVLLDENATLENIRKALERIISDSKEEDSVLIYFSGHGGLFKDPSMYSAILPVDFLPSDSENSCFSDKEFSILLKKIKARKILVILDACHSGGAVDFKDDNATFQYKFSEKSADFLSEGIGRVIISSSREEETSMILYGDSNSTFTKHLLDAMRGACVTIGDGLIRVFDLFNHVSNTVNNDIYEKTGGKNEQHPQFKAYNLEDNFPIVLDNGGSSKSSTHQKPERAGEKNINWRDLVKIISNLYPMGPTDQDIWSRAGGDISRLRLGNNGRANWFSALDTLNKGGGGNINFSSLIETALDDYPNHMELTNFKLHSV